MFSRGAPSMGPMISASTRARSLVDIVLTTYPAHKSMNVGDALITQSCLKLLKARLPEFQPVVLFREKPLDGFKRRPQHRVFAPGFSVSDGVYPKIYSLFTDLSRLSRFWPMGCSFQSPLRGREAFEVPYSKDTLEFLTLITGRFGRLPCRDELIAERLRRFGLPAHYFGDLGLFDEDRIAKPARIGRDISSCVISVPHHLHYIEQTIDLAKRIARTFPHWRRYVSLQSKPSNHAVAIQNRLAQLGYAPLNIYGEADGFEAYEDIDLHVGYRLHGHIQFLRNRKPSVLMVEDVRAYGFSRTSGTALGCIDALDERTGEPRDEAPAEAMRFMEERIAGGFADYSTVFDFIDTTYTQRVRPYFDRIAEDFA